MCERIAAFCDQSCFQLILYSGACRAEGMSKGAKLRYAIKGAN
jgi:hypothetical protein